MRYEEFTIEGRNAVIEAYRAGRPIDKLFILDGCQDGPILTIKREAKAKQTPVKFVTKERLDQLSETGKHQGVIAYAAAYEYATVEEILDNARQKGEAPFLFLLDNIEDPAQPRRDYPNRQPGGRTRRDRSQKPGGRADGGCGKNQCRSA